MSKLALLTLWLIIESSDAGTSFIRWGRTVCPVGSQKLYKGYMAGKNYNKAGSGGNYLCAHENPKFLGGAPGFIGNGVAGILTGVEFQLHGEYGNTLFKNDNIPGGGALYNQDLPCVRCYVADATDQMMIPGRPDCGSSGYDLMYYGYLASMDEWSDRQPSDYICLDEKPEGRAGGSGDENNAFIYPVEVQCGSLPCNPYVDGMEVTCAVCTY
jgi:hypothetical protein